MNNLKIGDTFEFATRKYGLPIHTPPIPCIVLKTNVDVGTNNAIPTKQCPTCKTVIGFMSVSIFAPELPYKTYQILTGNKKLILAFNNDCMQYYQLKCPESQTK